MLTEIALTPHIFDEASNGDVDTWLDSLRDLGANLSPRTAASPAIVSDLFSGSWYPEVLKTVASIQDHRARALIQSIVTQIKKYLVTRPEKRDWPLEELDWVKEAHASHMDEPLGRIVTADILEDCSAEISHPSQYSLRQLIDDREGFWNDIVSQRDVPMNIEDQVQILRPICAHAQFLTICDPHVKGSEDDETIFVAKLIESATTRGQGFPEVKKIELHLDGENRCREPLDDASLNCLQTNIHKIIQRYVGRNIRIVYCFRKHFIFRRLVAGSIEFDNGEEKRSPRWGVAFSHIARPADDAPPEAWNLVQQRDLVEFCKRLKPTDSDILRSGSLVT